MGLSWSLPQEIGSVNFEVTFYYISYCNKLKHSSVHLQHDVEHMVNTFNDLKDAEQDQVLGKSAIEKILLIVNKAK